MTKGVSAKFVSYSDTVPRLLKLLKFDVELKNHNKIVIKPFLRDASSAYTSPAMVEQVLRFCLNYKAEGSQIFIAEGADGADTRELFDQVGYKKLAEQYNVGLIDLNSSELEQVSKKEFSKFESIHYPKILNESFVISVSPLSEDSELGIVASLSSMVGAYSSKKYKGFFGKKKDKIRNWPMAYSVHDIIQCKSPDFAIIDASSKGLIFAGKPLDMDKEAAKLLGKDSKGVAYIRLIDETQQKAAYAAENTVEKITGTESAE